VHLLADHGVEAAFGIPGVHTLELFRGLGSSAIRHVLNRSEQGAVFAADGYARVTGRPGVALLISGPGVTNAATAVAQAYHDSIPLLIVSAVTPRARADRDTGGLHEMPDQQAFMSTITAWSEHVDDPAQLPGVLERAFGLFASSRPRPVHVQVPADLLREIAPELRARAPTAQPPEAADDRLEAAAALLRTARRPMIVLGGGAVDSGAGALALADRLGAPIVTSLNAKGAVPDAHPLSLGTRLPTTAALDALRSADVIVAAGTEFSEVDYYYAGAGPQISGRLIRIDIDERQLDAKFSAAVGLLGTCAATLSELAAMVSDRTDDDIARGLRWAGEVRSATEWWERAQPLMGLVDAVGAALPEDAVVAVDSTQLAYIGQQVWPSLRPRAWIVPSGWATLGSALPMAIGAAAADPQRPAYCVAGDGGVLYTIGEMAAAASLRCRLTLLLWNNDGYEEMRDEFDLAGIPRLATDASAHDFCAIADGFGWRALQPSDLADVAEMMVASRTSDAPTLIELTPALLA
jgi:thiamine pyrophosphate-dependent acetolactate synthase large subunit-like protein